jgi:hypothetical protein
MRMKSMIPIALLLLLSLPAAGQQCVPTDTPQSCWDKFVPAFQQPAAPAMTAQTNKQVATMNTGITNLISPSDSALKDFLTLLSASLESATFSESEGQALTFDWNPQFEILGSPGTFKFQAVFNNAQLSSKLTTALGDNTTAVTALDDSLDLESDVTLSGTVNPNNRRFGRSIKPHRQYFENWLTAFALDGAKADEEFAAAIESVDNLVLTTSSTRPSSSPTSDCLRPTRTKRSGPSRLRQRRPKPAATASRSTPTPSPRSSAISRSSTPPRSTRREKTSSDRTR